MVNGGNDLLARLHVPYVEQRRLEGAHEFVVDSPGFDNAERFTSNDVDPDGREQRVRKRRRLLPVDAGVDQPALYAIAQGGEHVGEFLFHPSWQSPDDLPVGSPQGPGEESLGRTAFGRKRQPAA